MPEPVLSKEEKELAQEVYEQYCEDVARLTDELLAKYLELQEAKHYARVSFMAEKFGVSHGSMSWLLRDIGPKPTPAIIYARERIPGTQKAVKRGFFKDLSKRKYG